MIELSNEQIEDIDDRLSAYDRSHHRRAPEGKVELGVMVDGQLVAGIFAEMSGISEMYVSTLFVDEAYRRRGIASRLMAAMESRARAMGAKHIRLDTFDFQGVDFYRNLGYEEVGYYASNDGAYAEHFFLKRLL
jgi:ribosomal protein S18 acetylase RimI-like enzyme